MQRNRRQLFRRPSLLRAERLMARTQRMAISRGPASEIDNPPGVEIHIGLRGKES